MAHVTFTSHLTRFFPDLVEGHVEAATVRELVQALERRHPGFASFVVDEAGRLRRHVNIFVGEEPIRDRDALGDRLEPDTPVFIVQALSGG